MPGDFLSHTRGVGAPTSGARAWTIVGSCALHGALVAAILILPALGAIDAAAVHPPHERRVRQRGARAACAATCACAEGRLLLDRHR